MADLSAFPITRQYPAKDPTVLQYYGLPTPNGVKVSIMLEEIGLPYEVASDRHHENESWTPEYLTLNPNGKIPAILDPDGPGGKPLALFESGAILIYLAEKTGKLLSADPATCGTRPSSGSCSRWARSVRCSDRSASSTNSRARPTRTSVRCERYVAEAKRLLGVLETRLEGRDWIMDDYSIADVAMMGWVRNLIGFYEARDLVDFDSLKNVPAWLERALARPAVQRGLNIPARP
jgi:GST-like protein